MRCCGEFTRSRFCRVPKSHYRIAKAKAKQNKTGVNLRARGQKTTGTPAPALGPTPTPTISGSYFPMAPSDWARAASMHNIYRHASPFRLILGAWAPGGHFGDYFRWMHTTFRMQIDFGAKLQIQVPYSGTRVSCSLITKLSLLKQL